MESFFLPSANASESQLPDEQLDRKIAFLIELNQYYTPSLGAKTEDVRSVLEKFKIQSKVSCEVARGFRQGFRLELSKDGYQILVWPGSAFRLRLTADCRYELAGWGWVSEPLGYREYSGAKNRWGIHPDCLLKMDNSGETFLDVEDRYYLALDKWDINKFRNGQKNRPKEWYDVIDRHKERSIERAKKELIIQNVPFNEKEDISLDIVDDKFTLIFSKDAVFRPKEMRMLREKVEAYSAKNPYLTVKELKNSLPSIKAEYEKGLAVATSLGEGEYYALRRIVENLKSCCEDSNCRLAADDAGFKLDYPSETSTTGAE